MQAVSDPGFGKYGGASWVAQPHPAFRHHCWGKTIASWIIFFFKSSSNQASGACLRAPEMWWFLVLSYAIWEFLSLWSILADNAQQCVILSTLWWLLLRFMGLQELNCRIFLRIQGSLLNYFEHDFVWAIKIVGDACPPIGLKSKPKDGEMGWSILVPVS